MYIRKEILSAIILSAGIIILTALAVLYCFTEVQIPSWCLWGGMDRMSFRNGELREEDRRVKKQQGVLA